MAKKEKTIPIMMTIKSVAVVKAYLVDNIHEESKELKVKKVPGQNFSAILDNFKLPDPAKNELYEATILVTTTVSTCIVFFTYVSKDSKWVVGETNIVSEGLPYTEYLITLASLTAVLKENEL